MRGLILIAIVLGIAAPAHAGKKVDLGTLTRSKLGVERRAVVFVPNPDDPTGEDGEYGTRGTKAQASCARKQLAEVDKAITEAKVPLLQANGATAIVVAVVPVLNTTRFFVDAGAAWLHVVLSRGKCKVVRKKAILAALADLPGKIFSTVGLTVHTDQGGRWDAELLEEPLALNLREAGPEGQGEVWIGPKSCEGVTAAELAERLRASSSHNPTAVTAESNGRHAFTEDYWYYVAVMPHPDQVAGHFLVIRAHGFSTEYGTERARKVLDAITASPGSDGAAASYPDDCGT